MLPDPESTYQIAKVRHAECIRQAEADRLAQQVQGDQRNRAKELLNTVVTFAKRVGAKSIETAQTGEAPQIELSSEQP